MIWAVSLSTTKLIPRSLTATLHLTGIRSLSDVSKLVGPISQTVALPPASTRNAAPKCISGRTSYHGVLLAFHPYPHLIPQVFNPGGSGPPRGLTPASPWTWVDHSASGPQHATHHALFRLGFPTATPQRVNLATHHDSQAHSAKGTPSQPQKGPLWRLDSTRFQVLFHHPSPGHFSPFPHGTSALSVTRTYFGLTGGPARFTRNSSSSVLLGNTPTPRLFLHLRDCHPLRYRFPTAS